MKHHETMPLSAFNALKKCACYKPSQIESEYATEGTRVHKEIEEAIKAGVTETDNKEVSYALDAIKYVYGLINKPLYEDIQIEQKLSLYDDEFKEVTFGTADIIIDNYIIDWKTGNTERDYYNSMLAYARGLMQRSCYETVTVIIVYTKLGKMLQREITFNEAMEATESIINSVTNPNKKPSQCEYCSWCEKFHDCDQTVKKHLPAIVNEYSNEEILNYHSSQLTDPIAMGKLLTIAREVIKKWVESVEFHAKEMLKMGLIPEGYKLKETSGKRSIRSAKEVYENSGLYPDQFFQVCNISLSDLQAMMNLKKKDFDKFIEPYVEKGNSSTSLVKE